MPSTSFNGNEAAGPPSPTNSGDNGSGSSNDDALPPARAQARGSTYIPRVDRQHIGQAEHEQYKSKYAAEVRGLRSRIDDLWGGPAWFTQQIVPGYGRAGSHDRVLYTIQQLARGSPGEGGEGGRYPERVRQAIEDAVHARLAEENKNRKAKRENPNLRAVVTTNDFKTAAKALGCVSLRMPAGQPRKARQPKRNGPGSRTAQRSDSAEQVQSNDLSNSHISRSTWTPSVPLSSIGSTSGTNDYSPQDDYIYRSGQVAPPPLPKNEEEVRANRAAFFAKYEADRARKGKETPSTSTPWLPTNGLVNSAQGGEQRSSSPASSSTSSHSLSRQSYSNMHGMGQYGGTSVPWTNGSRDSNERWSNNQPSTSNGLQFNQSYQEADLVGRERIYNQEMNGSFSRETGNGHELIGNPNSPNTLAANSSSNSSSNSTPSLLRSIPSPSMSHPPTSLASHSLSHMSSPQLRNMGQSDSPIHTPGRAPLPSLPSLSLPPLSNGTALPPLNWNQHQRKRGSDDEGQGYGSSGNEQSAAKRGRTEQAPQSADSPSNFDPAAPAPPSFNPSIYREW